MKRVSAVTLSARIMNSKLRIRSKRYCCGRPTTVIGSLGCSAGVCLAPTTPIEAVSRLVSGGLVDLVNVLSVHPGIGGQPFQADAEYLEDRISESLGLLYAMHWPFRQYESARGVRLSPLQDRIDAAGAVWGETAGWERPNWYADDGQAREYEYSYGKQNWHNNMVRECRGVREAVGLFDQTSFAKARVEGPDALAMLNYLSVANIDAPIDKAVYTQWCNHKGGIEADLTVTRTGHDTFFVVTAAAAENRDFTWLRRAASGAALRCGVRRRAAAAQLAAIWRRAAAPRAL